MVEYGHVDGVNNMKLPNKGLLPFSEACYF